MAAEGWTRRELIRGLGAVALAVAGSRSVGAESAGASAPRDREARRRWALARMDEMAQERARCANRFREAARIRDCQIEFERRHRAYNETYLEAARE